MASLADLRAQSFVQFNEIIEGLKKMKGGETCFRKALLTTVFNASFDGMYSQLSTLSVSVPSMKQELKEYMDNKKYKWPAYEEPPHYAHQEKLNDIRARFVSKRAILVDLFTYVNGRVDDITDVLELCKAIGFATGILGNLERILKFHDEPKNRQSGSNQPDVDFDE